MNSNPTTPAASQAGPAAVIRPCEPPVLEDVFCEVLVIGSGIAGLWCAWNLARRGIDTVVLASGGTDKSGFQGASVRSAGAINTAPLREAGFLESLENMGRGQVNPTIAPILRQRLGEELAALESFTAITPIRIGVKPEGDTRSLLEKVRSAFLALGGRAMDGRMTRLAADSSRCQGVQYENAGGIGRIRCANIVIASGGYASLLPGAVQTGAFGSVTGEFLRAGGTLANLEFVFHHGFGQPDLGALTPTEELQGAIIVNQQGDHVTWLEEAFFDGAGTHQHQRAAEYWRSHRQDSFYVQLGYRELYQAVVAFNGALARSDSALASSCANTLRTMFPESASAELDRQIKRALQDGRPFDYFDYFEIRACLPTPATPRQRIRHIPYFSMGGIAHAGCRTGLHNVYVTGEAMHDFGADRVGGLPWALYLSAGSDVAEQIVDRQSDWKWRSDAEEFELVPLRSEHDLAMLAAVREILDDGWGESFSVANATHAVCQLRQLRREVRRTGYSMHEALSWATMAEAILVSTLAREESRGCFGRNDYPSESARLRNTYTFTKYLAGEDRVIASLVSADDYVEVALQQAAVETECA